MKNLSILLLIFLNAAFLPAQNSFNYSVSLVPVQIPNLPGLHSFAHAQHNGKWLLIGGRKDGIHARQPFNAFPPSQNNTEIYVVDVNTKQVWSAGTDTLSTSLREQMQATNANFEQEGSALYITGGYAYSATANDHITFPYLTSVDVPGLISAVTTGAGVGPYFKQISNDVFAVTGGQLAKFNSQFYLVGGHRFDGRYNPMNNPTFVQTYTNEIRKFTVDNSGNQLSFGNYSTISDPVHLHRRDYNLLPQIYPNGEQGLMISSGVFQISADLPYLYPVEIRTLGYVPVTNFNQYLSNYHSANVSLFDAGLNEMHSLFFGGISQYYYQNGTLVQDDQVPFVKTVSRLTRKSSGELQEFKLPVEMPKLKGTAAEFLYNRNLPQYSNDIIKLNDIPQNSFIIGHIVGGIESATLNPFSSNQTGTTAADSSVYEVWLTKNELAAHEVIDGKNPYRVEVSPNPYTDFFKFSFVLNTASKIHWFMTDLSGKMIAQEQNRHFNSGKHAVTVKTGKTASQNLLLTVVFDDTFYVTKKLVAN